MAFEIQQEDDASQKLFATEWMGIKEKCVLAMQALAIHADNNGRMLIS